MPYDDVTKARQVHALLSSAHPHRGDKDLMEAASLLVMDRNAEQQGSPLLAIQTAITAIENGVGSIEGQKLLLEATREASLWVQRCSSRDR